MIVLASRYALHQSSRAERRVFTGGMMLTKEFIAELKKARDMFEWALLQESGSWGERRTTPRLRVRGKVKNDPDRTVLEPIGAVCLARTGVLFSEDYWVEAALAIGLPVQDARDIIAAANDITCRTVGDHREPDPYKQALRQWLVEATGLETSMTAPESILFRPCQLRR